MSALRSPTTGEPVATVARRNRLGVWLCIISDATGTFALLIAYAYLWSLNVNDAWAPPKDAFADPLLFWVIAVGGALTAGLLWWAHRLLVHGGRKEPFAVAVIATLLVLGTAVLQIVQLSTFPFGADDGAYASATFWLCIGAVIHLGLVLILAMGVAGRTRAGLISPENPSQAKFVAMYATWAAIAIFLGALFATTMTTSPNTSSPAFGEFQAPAPSSSPATSSASPSAAPSSSSGS
ncbi:MAG: cytochrome c oxidase subunit 3 [Actinomycetales bacterium]|jgi:heme/copper-type cytochrome/quinol oxidase subunit 3